MIYHLAIYLNSKNIFPFSNIYIIITFDVIATRWTSNRFMEQWKLRNICWNCVTCNLLFGLFFYFFSFLRFISASFFISTFCRVGFDLIDGTKADSLPREKIGDPTKTIRNTTKWWSNRKCEENIIFSYFDLIFNPTAVCIMEYVLFERPRKMALCLNVLAMQIQNKSRRTENIQSVPNRTHSKSIEFR